MLEKNEENSDIGNFSNSDSDSSSSTVRLAQEDEIESLESSDGAAAHSISNKEHEGIPILNEAIDTKHNTNIIITSNALQQCIVAIMYLLFFCKLLKPWNLFFFLMGC